MNQDCVKRDSRPERRNCFARIIRTLEWSTVDFLWKRGPAGDTLDRESAFPNRAVIRSRPYPQEARTVGCVLVRRSMLTTFILLLAPLDARSQSPTREPSPQPAKQAPAPAPPTILRPKKKGWNTPWARAPEWSLWHPLHLKAMQHYTEGDFAQAQVDLEQIVRDCGEFDFNQFMNKNDYIRQIWEKMPAERDINQFLEANNLGILGCAHVARGHYDEAEHFFTESLAYFKSRSGASWSINTGIAGQRAAFLLAARGRYQEAADLERLALTHVETIDWGQCTLPPPSCVAMIRVALAEIEIARGRLPAADQCLRRAANVQVVQRHIKVGPTAVDQAALICVSAHLRYQQGRYSEAYNLWGQALELIRSISKDNPLGGYSLDGLGEVDLIRGNLGPAAAHFREALAVREGALGKQHREVAYSLDGLGRVAVARGDRNAAGRHFQRASEILEKALGPDHPDTAEIAAHSKALDRRDGGPTPQPPRFLAIPTFVVLGWWYTYSGSDWVSLAKALDKKDAKTLKKDRVEPARPVAVGAKNRKACSGEETGRGHGATV